MAVLVPHATQPVPPTAPPATHGLIERFKALRATIQEIRALRLAVRAARLRWHPPHTPRR